MAYYWIRSCASQFPAHCTRHCAARPPLQGKGVWFGFVWFMVWFGLVGLDLFCVI